MTLANPKPLQPLDWDSVCGRAHVSGRQRAMVEAFYRDLLGQPEIARLHGTTQQSVSRNLAKANERILAVAPQGKWRDCAGCGRRIWSPEFGVRRCAACADALRSERQPRPEMQGLRLSPEWEFSRNDISGGGQI